MKMMDEGEGRRRPGRGTCRDFFFSFAGFFFQS